MSIYLNNLNNEIVIINKFKSFNKKNNEIIKRKSFYINIKIDISFNN